MVSDKLAVKSLLSLLGPLPKQLGNSHKLFLTPLTRYWVAPCCEDVLHHTKYILPGYLPGLGEAIHSLRDNIGDSLFTRRVANFHVLCPNQMVGVGQWRQEPTDEEATATVALWGPDRVHPMAAACRQMAGLIEKDLLNTEAQYTNPTGPPLPRASGVSNWLLGSNSQARPTLPLYKQRAWYWKDMPEAGQGSPQSRLLL
jgi:hypothetical protein